MTKSINDLKPDDKVKSCKYLERALCMQLQGVTTCCNGTKTSKTLVTTEEIQSGKASYELIVQRKQELFEAINGFSNIDSGACKDCVHIFETEYKNVDLGFIGGISLGSMYNIQHYTKCNERCSYCCYAKKDELIPPQYDILKIYDMYKNKGKILEGGHIDFSGGEPAMLKDFNKILHYLVDNKMGDVVVYSNSTIFNQGFCDLLKNGNISITTSLDTGIKSSYAKLRGVDVFEKVIENLIKYRNSGTNKMSLKYVITEDNRTDDDMWSFILAMLALRPNVVLICPDFPYGDREIPDETVKFAAKLWYYIERYLGNVVRDYTGSMGDPKFIKYQKDLAEEIKALKDKNPIDGSTILKPYCYPACPKPKFSFKDKCKKIRSIVNIKISELLR